MKKLFLLLLTAIILSLGAQAQMRKVSGTVVETPGDEPIFGASVMPVGGGEGAQTDFEGKFTINVPASVSKVTVSYVGMETVTVPITDHMVVRLKSTDMALETVVVTGYGSAKKLGSVVGSVAVVTAEAFEDVPTPNFVDALQGQVAGLSIFSASGEPSSTDNDVRLRGVNSINADNSPLFILDGAPVTQSVFTTLNPNDIESISVLKDAASIAIYGSRAANGVIVITTKRGRFEQAPSFTLRASVGWSAMVSDNVEMMNSSQLIQYRDLVGKPVSDEVRELVDKYGIDTKWRNEVFNGHAPTYTIEGALSGGGDRSSYYLSVNHMDQEGIVAHSGMRREIIRASLRSRVADWLTIGFQSNLGYTKYDSNQFSDAADSGVNGNNPMVFSRMAFPYDAPYYYTIDENGTMNKLGEAQYLRYTGLFRPEFTAVKLSNVSRNRLTINASIFEQLNPIKGLTLRAQQAVDAYDYRLNNIHYAYSGEDVPWQSTPIYIQGDRPDADGVVSGSNQQSFSRYYAFTYTNTAEYTHNFNDVHDITLLVGQESIIKKEHGFGVMGRGYTDNRLMLLSQASEVQTSYLSESIGQSVFNSYFFNLNYSFADRYYLEASLRRDGSSKFAPGHRWGTFYAVGLMWHAKSEQFMQNLTWLDDCRVRASYGTTGNAGIGNYEYMGLVGQGSQLYNGDTTLGVAQVANPDLSWETVRAFDFGINARLVDRFTVDVNAYRKETVDMLLPIPYSFTTGFSSVMGNVGSMKNVGVDVDLRVDFFKNQDWYIGGRCNFNYNHNEITALFDGQDELAMPEYNLKYQVGHDAGEFYTVPWAGVDPTDGKQMWIDIDGNLTKTYNEERDARLIGKSMFSPWSGGWGLDARWKGISLRVDFAWAAKKYMINNDRYFVENNYFADQFNQMTSMLNVWTTPGQVTNIPAVGQTMQFDSHLIEDASFMRLKNLTVQYSLPKAWLQKASIKQANLHFTGRNLLTLTGYTGYDPEPESNVVAFWYPNTRQYEFGIDITF